MKTKAHRFRFVISGDRFVLWEALRDIRCRLVFICPEGLVDFCLSHGWPPPGPELDVWIEKSSDGDFWVKSVGGDDEDHDGECFLECDGGIWHLHWEALDALAQLGIQPGDRFHLWLEY